MSALGAFASRADRDARRQVPRLPPRGARNEQRENHRHSPTHRPHPRAEGAGGQHRRGASPAGDRQPRQLLAREGVHRPQGRGALQGRGGGLRHLRQRWRQGSHPRERRREVRPPHRAEQPEAAQAPENHGGRLGPHRRPRQERRAPLPLARGVRGGQGAPRGGVPGGVRPKVRRRGARGGGVRRRRHEGPSHRLHAAQTQDGLHHEQVQPAG